MTENETTSGGAKRRVVALVATGATVAALAVGGFTAAGAANAATGLVVSLSARPLIYGGGAAPLTVNGTTVSPATDNNDSPNQPLQVTLDNTGSSTPATGSLNVTISGIPQGISCTAVSLTAYDVNGASPAVTTGAPVLTSSSAATTGTCTFTGTYAIANATANTYDYREAINSVPTGGTVALGGTLSQVASVTNTASTATVATSNSVSTVLSAGTAPVAVATSTGGTIYQNFNKQVMKPGAPIGNVTATDVSTATPANGTTPASAGKTASAGPCPVGQLGEGEAACYHLYNYSKVDSNGNQLAGYDTGLYYNAITGYVFQVATSGSTGTATPDVYQILETNATGSAVTTANASLTFSDVPATNPFAGAIYALVNDGIIQGYADGTFQPAAAVSRQAFVHYLYVTLDGTDGQCSSSSPSAFTDVSDNSPFCKSINALNSLNIVNGYSVNIFNPSRSISRQAVAAILFRYYNYVVTKSVAGGDATCTSPTGFNDVKTSNPFCGDIQFLVKNGLTKGYSDGGYHPAQNVSRQATAQLLYNVLTDVYDAPTASPDRSVSPQAKAAIKAAHKS